MSSRPSIIEPGESTDENINKLLYESEEDWYGDAAFFGAMAHQPTLLTRIVSLFDAFSQGEHIDAETLELMRLKVAETHQCAYCATVRTQDVHDEVAPKEASVFGEVDTDALTRREYLAVRLAEQLSADPHRMTDGFFEALGEVYSDREIIELLLFASIEVGLDRFCIALALDTTERSPYPTGLEYPFENFD
ncbi:carboxymuconolactone decarboxylase family protein [Halocatena marina]|uniref:Carboxymuconolactone decarboxylase family protein n=1 Tax=Halocatena marina TaxID=2934937 RepID=A0ABD5YVL0_9EURY|nr:carboxymuconolactone decarboxylase family protein [Halocatena marina]